MERQREGLIADFKKYLIGKGPHKPEKKYAPNTAQAYSRKVETLLPEEITDLYSLAKEVIARAAKLNRERDGENQTQVTRKAAATTFSRFLGYSGKIEIPITVKKKPAKITAITEEEFSQLIKAIPKDKGDMPFRNPRDKAMLLISYETGAEPHSVVGIKYDDFQREDEIITGVGLRVRKGDPIEVRLQARTVAAIESYEEAYRESIEKSELLLPLIESGKFFKSQGNDAINQRSYRRKFSFWRKKAGLREELNLYSVRYGAVLRDLNKGMGIRGLTEKLGLAPEQGAECLIKRVLKASP